MIAYYIPGAKMNKIMKTRFTILFTVFHLGR